MKFENLILLVAFVSIISFAGLFAGMVYFSLETLDSVIREVDFEIPIENDLPITNDSITHFQDIMEITIYPILGLRIYLPIWTYFMVFAFVLALAMTAYMSSKNPIFFVVHLLFTFILTYFCFILSNSYRTILSDPFLNQMMVEFVIYNKLMMYLPQIVFFTSLVFGVISFINMMKPVTSESTNTLQYGGDY